MGALRGIGRDRTDAADARRRPDLIPAAYDTFVTRVLLDKRPRSNKLAQGTGVEMRELQGRCAPFLGSAVMHGVFARCSGGVGDPGPRMSGLI